MKAFIELFSLPFCVLILYGLLTMNSKRLDVPQRISLGVAVVALAVFLGCTLAKKPKSAGVSPTASAPQPAKSGSATTSGGNSPAITGDGNTVNYEHPSAKRPTPSKKE